METKRVWRGGFGGVVVAVVALLYASNAARADTKNWIGGNGVWGDGGSWTLPGVPEISDKAFITQTAATVQYQNPSTPDGAIWQLKIDAPVVAPTLVMAGSELQEEEANVGLDFKGTLTQSGGVHSVLGPAGLYVGRNATGVGTYNLSGTGVLNVTNGLRVGYDGVGTFNQTGGSVVFGSNGSLNLAGGGGGGTATYNLSGGSVTGASLSLGSGTATFNHTGGTASFSKNMVLNAGAGKTVTYNLSGGGSLSGAGGLFVGVSGGTATFNQAGGTNAITGLVVVGSGSPGAYTMSGGTLTASGMTVGVQNPGSFQQSGGNVAVAGNVLIGAAGGVAGQEVYHLDGGSLTAANLSINDSGVLEQTAGSFETGALSVQGTGRVSLSGGTMKVGSIVMSAGGATIDLQAAGLLVDYAAGSPLNSLKQRVQNGYNGGGWGGAGITSSTAAADSTGAVGYGEASTILGLAGGATAPWHGYTADAGSILVRYTRAGDTNLDGAVDFTDLVALAQNYNTPTGAVWTQGDFNYDWAVDFQDLVKLAQHYTQPPPAMVMAMSADAAFAGDVMVAFAQVPEPGVGVALVGLAGALYRRRR